MSRSDETGPSREDGRHHDPFDSPKFHELIGLLRKQTASLETLAKDALRDELPYNGGKWNDEPAWNALFQSTMRKTKERAEEWKSGMDATLVFIALFLTVVTAFLIPVTQSLSAGSPTAPVSITIINSSNIQLLTINSTAQSQGKPPQPAISTQVITFFFYMALIGSVLTAILCVLGRQWIGQMTSIPYGDTFLERTLRHEARKEMAEKWLAPLVSTLQGSLISSIAFFVFGFLYQLWCLTISFETPPVILVIVSVLGTLSSSLVALVIAATVGHAVCHRQSPFQSPFSTWLGSKFRIWFSLRDQPIDRPFASVFEERLPQSMYPRATEDTDMMTKNAMNVYSQLVADLTESELLDTVVPSLLDRRWIQINALEASLLAAIRFLSTDSSLRVKVTIAQYLHRLPGRLFPVSGVYVTPLLRSYSQKIIALLHGLYQDATAIQAEYRKDYFLAMTSFICDMNNLYDAMDRPWRQSYEECIAHILASYQIPMPPSDDHKLIFDIALDICLDTHRTEKDDVLTDIVSHVDRDILVKSLIRQPHRAITLTMPIVLFAIKGNEESALRAVDDFIRALPDDDENALIYLRAFAVHVFIAHQAGINAAPPGLERFPRLVKFIKEKCNYKEKLRACRTFLNSFEYVDMSWPIDRVSVLELLRLCESKYLTRQEAQYYIPYYTELPPSSINLPGMIISEEFASGNIEDAEAEISSEISVGQRNRVIPMRQETDEVKGEARTFTSIGME
ncbi:hypothetical protein SISNIDRAFT_456579 [Sistotremastrum niveocremeum HHB9708]|uniref:DUF6535 domain-containing protein n=1 Tax=Sistotremastrum niveocremeum HHB9708 TaxID=1314777 RepID=A0A164SNA2_9AGAM|nr:hypothetical protein SISNIDRAFT_456579 [Sistotremastrum niveocremeum HHB9708]